ncbi:hypothetical protein JZ751_012502 [Albula glossodonta]|uniref:Uncharacterized protein n=1 Tax=Albula glossodonta TaxID=121402 RepID=A0A8T2NWZ5_9TELE|nr:hypothetical protein JZ751_012502 [Albula glossodonta]
MAGNAAPQELEGQGLNHESAERPGAGPPIQMLICPANMVMRRMMENPVSRPAFWIRKKEMTFRVVRSCSAMILLISGN